MDFEEFSKELKELSKTMEIEVSNEQCDKLYKYMNLLIEYNKNVNLTAITEPKEIILKHFIDSLTIEKNINETSKVLDVGTGAEFPGVPLSIKKQGCDYVLADSLNKRISFLEIVKKEINLDNVKLIHGRAEEMAKDINHREKYDIVTSRAVARLNVLLEYMLPFVKIGGKCICMKGSNYEEELEEAKNAIEILGGKIDTLEKTYLPNSDIMRTNIIIKKVKETQNKYPRKPGTPAKEPIS